LRVPSNPQIGAARQHDFPAARAKEAFYQGLKGRNRGKRNRGKIVLRVDGNLSTVG
jgi:hypothetical protein